jgi:hypothetical protein
MSQPEQASAASIPTSEPQIEQDIRLVSPCSSVADLPVFQSEKAYDLDDFHYSNFLICEDFQQPPFTAEVAPEHLENRLLPLSSLASYNQFQDMICPGYVRQTLLEYLSEANLAHEAWQCLQRDTTCGDTCTGCWESKAVDLACSSRLSVEELFHLSQRFSSTLDAMVSAGTLTICDNIDSTLILSVYSRIRDIHDMILQQTTQSLQLSKDAVVRITGGWHRLYM